MKCPGQDSRYWKPGAIFDVKCPGCGEMIEFFKDDTRRRCPNCGQEVPNPEMDFGCAAYCPYAEHCLGGLASEKAGDSKLKIMKAGMAKTLRSIYQNDSRKVARGANFLELCEEIGKKEGADLGIVVLSGFAKLLLEHDTGFGKFRDSVEELMKRLLLETGADEKLAQDCLSLLERALSGQIREEQDIKNYNVIKDASLIADFEAEGRKDWDELLKSLLTESARQMAHIRAAVHGS